MRALTLLLGCSDYELAPEPKAPGMADPADPVDPAPVDTAETAVPTDTADTAACTVPTATPRAESDPTCAIGATPADPWTVVEKWTVTGGDAITTPAIGDLDGDGVAEVVVVVGDNWTDTAGDLVVVDGATGTITWRVPGQHYVESGVAIADVDLDGTPEVLAVTSTFGRDARLVAFGAGGTVLWRTAITSAWTAPIASDLDQDGDVEVVAGGAILNGATGTLRSTFGVSAAGPTTAVDLDGDGDKELLAQGYVLSAVGATQWTCAPGAAYTNMAPLNADADPEGEVLTVADGLATLCDTGGAVRWTRRMRGLGAPPAIADFDGDGAQEIVLADEAELVLLEADGTPVWSLPITDFSGASGASSWDVDGDGIPEVLYADEVDLLVVDGRTGAVRIRQASHSSVTEQERPVAADIDGDGHGEIVFVSSGEHNGAALTALEAAADDWPWARPVWNAHDYAGVDVTDALAVPATPDTPWASPAMQFPGQASALLAAPHRNLRVAITAVCAATCDATAPAEIALQVWNDGALPVDAGAVLELSAHTGATATVLATLVLAEVPPGGSVEHIVTTEAGALGEELRAVVDPSGAVPECHEDDQDAVYTDLPCG